MKAFPMFIKTTGRRVVIVGGGEQAAQKARLLLKTDADLVFAALQLDPEIEALVETGRATWHEGPLTEAFLKGAAMVFVATGCFAVDVSAHAIAKAAGCLVNVVDQPHLCDMTTPSLVDRDPVVIAIGTEGTAPVLARQIKTQIEQNLPQNLGGLAALAGRLRPSVSKNVERAKRRALWTWVFSGKPRALWDRGAEAHAATMIKEAISNRFRDGSGPGAVSIIDAGYGETAMQTLRAVQRLQDADVILFDQADAEPILELARRDAQRIFIGDTKAQSPWPPSWIQSRVFAQTKNAANVVFVTGGYAAHRMIAATWQEHAEANQVTLEFVPSASMAPVAPQEHNKSQTRQALRAI